MDVCSTTFLSLTVTEIQAKNLAEATKQQAKSDVWMNHRKGRITASHMHNILKYKGKRYPTSIVKSIMQYYSVNPNVPALKWGKEHEEVARHQYISLMKNRHINFSVAEVGLTIDPAYPYLGATPDGMATCDCCGQRIMEIKCPFKTRQYHPTSDHAMQNSHFLKRDANGSVSLSSNHEYYTQIQGQLLLCHQAKCDFIVWTTNGIYIETIHSDKPLQAKIVSQCKDFFVCYVLPELITHKLQDNEKPMTNEELYCICGRGEDGYMIACDNPTCPYQWFHFSCIGMESKPNGSWFCDRCKLLQ